MSLETIIDNNFTVGMTNEPFKIPEVGSFCVEEISDMDEHLYTKLNVSENPMGINGQPYATVNDKE